MANRLQIGVIFGGRSGEHEVSLMSARSVLSVLDPARYTVTQIGITKEGLWFTGADVLSALESGQTAGLHRVALLPEARGGQLYEVRPDGQLQPITRLEVIFPVLHGTFGEDGTLQGLLELADVAYIGAGVLSSAVGMDKGLFKEVMRSQGIPIARWLIVNRQQVQTAADQVIEQAESISPYPLFVKPANLGSSVGVTKCQNRSDLLEGLLDAARYDRRILIEEGIPAREIEVSVLGNEDPIASIPGEVLPSREFYSYESKYIDGTSGLLIPAPIEPSIAEEARQLAIRAYKAIDGAGMARVDFLLHKQTGQLYLNEVNTIPGFTQISMYPKLWEASGMPYQQLVDHLIELALARKAERDATERSYGRSA